MMVRPAAFGFNAQTAESNAFQTSETELSKSEISKKAQEEFDGFVALLRRRGVNVIVIEDSFEPLKPDAVFPNNWITFHHNGTVITYPMQAPSRRVERREDVIEMIKDSYEVKRRVRFEEYETEGRFLEGTGSMILDRVHRRVYACISPRTEPRLLDEFCAWANYEKVEFRARDGEGVDIYHTNVMMAMGETFVVICMDSVTEPNDQKKLYKVFEETDKEIINITLGQMMSFAGNMLQVRNEEGETILVMSSQAYDSLTEGQVSQIEKHTSILHAPINTIEKFGGGSARCMMAEVFLPVKA